MARIAFVQNLAFEHLGVMYLSGVLKESGHNAEAFIGIHHGKIAAQIANYKPDLVGFSCMSGNYQWYLQSARAIKERVDVLTIFGGIHPTFFPEIIKDSGVDIVCRGEAELALLNLIRRIDSHQDIKSTPNCWFKNGGRVIQNQLSPLVDNLDNLPFPDRDIYYKKYRFLNRSQKVFIAGRGCPFKCSYCFNEAMQLLYQDKGRYVRHRTVGNVLDEIVSVRNKYGLRTVYMIDDTFILDKQWVCEFLDRYAKEIRLPFICLLRADLLDYDIAKRLRKANCHRVFFAIESGSEKLRNVVLGKRITDEQVIYAASLLRANGIRFRTYNMLGIPEETLEEALETVMINIKIKSDYPWCSILQPYPQTRIEKYAREKDMLPDKPNQLTGSFFKKTPLLLKNRRELENLQKLFFITVKFPFLLPLVKRLIKFPPNFVFDLIFMFCYAYSYKKAEALGFCEFVSMGLRNRRSLLN